MNGWHGYTNIKYLCNEETIKFSSGDTLSFMGADYVYYIRATFAGFLEAMIDEFDNEEISESMYIDSDDSDYGYDSE